MRAGHPLAQLEMTPDVFASARTSWSLSRVMGAVM